MSLRKTSCNLGTGLRASGLIDALHKYDTVILIPGTLLNTALYCTADSAVDHAHAGCTQLLAGDREVCRGGTVTS